MDSPAPATSDVESFGSKSDTTSNTTPPAPVWERDENQRWRLQSTASPRKDETPDSSPSTDSGAVGQEAHSLRGVQQQLGQAKAEAISLIDLVSELNEESVRNVHHLDGSVGNVFVFTKRLDRSIDVIRDGMEHRFAAIEDKLTVLSVNYDARSQYVAPDLGHLEDTYELQY